MKKQILAISGSVRKASVNQAILRYLQQAFTENLNIEIYDKVDQIPIFNPDLEEDLLPDIIKELQSKIAAADGIIISTPEYVFSLPGNLKNLLEWQVSTTLLSKKTVALIVAAASGKHAFQSLELVMSTITEGPIDDDLKLLLQGIGKKIDISGKISDEAVKLALYGLINAFIRKLS